VIFVDANIPMYLIGGAHPNKERAKALLEQLVGKRQVLVTDIEVFQEILHRYTAIERREAIEPAFTALNGIIDRVFDFGMPEVIATKELLAAVDGISARDALHVVIMRAAGATQILTFDKGFDHIAGVERIY
jgi:predicted nucleic acid-binding protein